mgnify:FL=1
MKISIMKVALVVSLIFNLSFMAAAAFVYLQKNSSWVSPFGVKLKKDHFLFEELSLRPDQAQRMRETAVPFRALIDQKRKAIAAQKNELLSLMRGDTTDQQAINRRLAEISRLQAEVESMVADHILQVKATLDKQQQQKFIDLLQRTMQQDRLVCLPTGK